jgi:hypothetical protein
MTALRQRMTQDMILRWAQAGALVVATRDGDLAGGCFLVDEVGEAGEAVKDAFEEATD